MSLQYIIDGYNLISHSLFSRTHKHISNKQKDLLTFIGTRKLTGSAKNKVTVVFDGYPPSSDSVPDNIHINIIFSRKISADDKIKKMVEEANNRKIIVVVSDDKEIRFIVRSLGARCIGIEEFAGIKEKNQDSQNEDLIKAELNYTQIHRINQELSKLWLEP